MSEFLLETVGTLKYDVVVCGGGVAGAAAAYAAAAGGAKTLLVESGGELGGDITKAIIPQVLDPVGKGGIVGDLYTYLNSGGHTAARHGKRYDDNGGRVPGTVVDLEYVKYFLEKYCRNAGVEFMYHSIVAGCETDGGVIRSVAAATECGSFRIEAKVFIDATGNGLVAAMCGCEYEIGHPVTGQPQPAGSSMLVTGIPKGTESCSGEEKELIKKSLAAQGIEVSAEGVSLIESAVDDVWLLCFNSEFNVMTDDPIALSRAAVDARAECVEVLDRLKKIDEYKDVSLLQTSSHIGIREGRRIKGRYRLTFDDITSGRRFDDAVCLVRFPIDVHRISADDKFVHNNGKRVIPYNIPYRALLPVGCENLLLAGRCISGDFYAHASYRVAGNAFPTGEAAGFAAAQCIADDILPGEVDGKRVSAYMSGRGYEL